MPKNSIKSEIAKEKPRDRQGHFLRAEKPKPQSQPKDPVSKFFSGHTRYSKNQDDLVNIHVGNPLRRITSLLEEIKRQKAFSFTFKGSLGIVGVALALSLFGIFGGGKLLCDKGIQSQIGLIKILNATEKQSSDIPFLSPLIDFFSSLSSSNPLYPRTLLVKNDNSAIHLPFSQFVDYALFQNRLVIATGNYDSCSQTLKINSPTSIELYR